ncbi:MAG: FAD-dependent oxidoreductase [Armatimonadetes bacterium]|nr:FAD-dependent oxidoreductase [Armatimonadota bacterium]
MLQGVAQSGSLPQYPSFSPSVGAAEVVGDAVPSDTTLGSGVTFGASWTSPGSTNPTFPSTPRTPATTPSAPGPLADEALQEAADRFGDNLDQPTTYVAFRTTLERAGGEKTFRGIMDAIEPKLRRRVFEGGCTPAEIIRAAANATPDARDVHDADVLVIGAGISGLAAAQDIACADEHVVVLEASDRVGGRLKTDPDWPVPIDMGAAWLHSSPRNALTDIVRAMGFTMHLDEPRRVVSGAADPVVEGEALDARATELDNAWRIAGRAADVPCSYVSAPTEPRDRMACELLGPLSGGVEVGQTSARDYATMVKEQYDRLVEQGLGMVVDAFSHGIPIVKNAPATLVKWGPEGVTVTANGEEYHAKKLVLSVSTGVLRSGKIVFDPPLPAWKSEAFKHLPMGHLDKVVLQFDPQALENIPAGTRVSDLADPERAIECIVRPMGKPVVVALVGGDQASAMERGTDAAACAPVLDRLHTLGVDAPVRKAAVTRWDAEPWVLGAYSAAEPGFQHARATLREPVDGVLYFAGEATQETWATTAAGAYLSGKDVAARLTPSPTTH